MSKYDAFGEFLRKQSAAHVPLTFAQIEKVISGKLPPSSRYSAWWSNNSANNVMTKIWLAAGFRSEQVDLSGRKVVFRRTEADRGAPSDALAGQGVRHPLFGAMKGLIRVPPGVDLTQPADPDWGRDD